MSSTNSPARDFYECIGNAGDLEVIADFIRLDNQGKFLAESVTGRGGNIQLQAEDLLLLRRGSLQQFSSE